METKNMYKVYSPNCAMIEEKLFETEVAAREYYQSLSTCGFKSYCRAGMEVRLENLNGELIEQSIYTGKLSECLDGYSESKRFLLDKIERAEQRAERGYSRSDAYDPWHFYFNLLPNMLRELKTLCKDGNLTPDLDKNDGSVLDKAGFDSVIDHIIDTFEACDFMAVYRSVYGDDHYDESEFTEEFINEVTRRERAAMQLWCKWGPVLWG